MSARRTRAARFSGVVCAVTPEPDAAIVRGRVDDYRDHHPGPADVLCVIEVADASLRRDRTVKQRIYANALIPLYLITNLPERRVEVYSQPIAGKGKYADKVILTAKDKLSLGRALGMRSAEQMLRAERLKGAARPLRVERPAAAGTSVAARV